MQPRLPQFVSRVQLFSVTEHAATGITMPLLIQVLLHRIHRMKMHTLPITDPHPVYEMEHHLKQQPRGDVCRSIKL